MEIKQLTKKDYEKWDEFCNVSDDCWFWHTSKWLEYTLNYNPSLNSELKSFFIIKNNKIIAICPLLLEEINGLKEFSFGGSYTPLPAFANELRRKEKEKVRKLIFETIDKLAKQEGVKKVSFRFVVLNKSFVENPRKNNYLMRFNYIDNSINTQVIDLRKDLGRLRMDVRHGHDSDIDKSSKMLKGEIFDKNNITKEIFDKYVDLHLRASGRKTRPQITFDMMFDWIKQGDAFLVGARLQEMEEQEVSKDRFIGFSYFFAYKNNVYYGSACNNPEIENKENIAIAHFIQWNAIEYMQRKYNFYELGWQPYSNTLADFPSEKELYISRFKRGFGGFTIPLFRGEKYYDKDYFLQIYDKRVKKFAENLENSD